MNILGFDHIVLCVRDVETTIKFYEDVLGLTSREERPGKWSLHFGLNKISLQDVSSVPEMAKGTTPGSGNFCLLSGTPLDELVDQLNAQGIEIVEGPAIKEGATGKIRSVYFHDPDMNLIEVSNPV